MPREQNLVHAQFAGTARPSEPASTPQREFEELLFQLKITDTYDKIRH
jgi:hypothetical protein